MAFLLTSGRTRRSLPFTWSRSKRDEDALSLAENQISEVRPAEPSTQVILTIERCAVGAQGASGEKCGILLTPISINKTIYGGSE